MYSIFIYVFQFDSFDRLLIEAVVKHYHSLSRARYVMIHYLVVVLAFATVFVFYHRFFDTGTSAFATTLTALGAILVIEIIVFRYVYASERWFLNFVDWIFPLFLATSTVYAVGFLW